MGDTRHKRPPPGEPDEEVTPRFRKAARKALELNAAKNKLGKRSKGDPGYLIANRSDLAEAVGTDKTQINHIIGPARETSKVKLVERSAFVGRIRTVLGLELVTQIAVPAARAAMLRKMAELDDDLFAVFEAEVDSRAKTDES